MEKKEQEDVLEKLRLVRNLIGVQGKYRDIILEESERYHQRERVNDCIEDILRVIKGSMSLQRCTRVTDGYLVPILNGEWCRVLDTVQGFKGFVVYNGTSATRVTMDSSARQCSVQKLDVGVIRGCEGVLRRFDINGFIVEEVHEEVM